MSGFNREIGKQQQENVRNCVRTYAASSLAGTASIMGANSLSFNASQRLTITRLLFDRQCHDVHVYTLKFHQYVP